MINTVRILLADDHAVVRSGVRRLLESKPEFQVIAEAADGDEAYQLYCEQLPDIAIIDFSMPGMGGMEAIRRIIARYESARLLIFSMHENPAFATQALRAGARAFVSKTGAPDELTRAITEVMRGNTYMSPNIAQKVALMSLNSEGDPFSVLSTREFEIFRMLALGKSAAEIAEALNISYKTVANYHTGIRQKLGVASAIDMLRLAMKHGVC